MMQTCKCQTCNKELGSMVEGFDGKTLFIMLDFQRFHSMCNKCKHQESARYPVWFCTVECLKAWVSDPEKIDKYVADEVYWGKYTCKD